MFCFACSHWVVRIDRFCRRAIRESPLRCGSVRFPDSHWGLQIATFCCRGVEDAAPYGAYCYVYRIRIGFCNSAGSAAGRFVNRPYGVNMRNRIIFAVVPPRRTMGAEALFKMTQVQGQTYAYLVSQDAVLRNTGLRACASVRKTGFSQPPSFRPSSLARRVQMDRRSSGRLGWILKEGNRNPSLSDSFATLF